MRLLRRMRHTQMTNKRRGSWAITGMWTREVYLVSWTVELQQTGRRTLNCKERKIEKLDFPWSQGPSFDYEKNCCG